jgi:hypothetical protein
VLCFQTLARESKRLPGAVDATQTVDNPSLSAHKGAKIPPPEKEFSTALIVTTR